MKTFILWGFFVSRASQSRCRLGTTVARVSPYVPACLHAAPALPPHSSPWHVGSHRSGDTDAASPAATPTTSSPRMTVPGAGASAEMCRGWGTPVWHRGGAGGAAPALPHWVLLTSAGRPPPPPSSSSGRPAPAGTRGEGPAPLLPPAPAAGGNRGAVVSPCPGPHGCPRDPASPDLGVPPTPTQ